jgi:anti-sigma regulatory factor (Ser/Thr protein kinase)
VRVLYRGPIDPGAPSAPRPPREVHLRVEPTVQAVGEVRALLRRLLQGWGMPEVLDSDIELLTSELVTNSVVHAATPTDVTISYDGTAVRVAARDGSHATPVVSAPDPEAEGGRGVWLVATLSSTWGVEPLPDGKRVWFDIEAGD